MTCIQTGEGRLVGPHTHMKSAYICAPVASHLEDFALAAFVAFDGAVLSTKLRWVTRSGFSRSVRLLGLGEEGERWSVVVAKVRGWAGVFTPRSSSALFRVRSPGYN